MEEPSVLPNTNDTTITNLYPALLQCFAIIICGYVAGRMGLISQTEGKGLNTFVSSFCLPALIFMSLAQLDLHSVNWMFLLSVLTAKAVVFAAVVVITLLISRPIHAGRAGLFAMFCTQSNDFAIGYPIVLALYGSTHPEYASYLYLMAPISLAILNPMGFVLMELHKQQTNAVESSSEPSSKWRLVGTIAKSVALNPIVFMTALGIIGNFVFRHHVPVLIGDILQALGLAFPAAALFLLGLRMVGKVHTLQGAALVVPGVLIAVKLLALPLIIREVVSLYHAGVNATDNLDLSTYGFLYGTFPSAPTVFVFATQYSLDVDLIASAMVACTFISAPLMFISARMVTLASISPTDYLTLLDAFALDISIAGIIACLWLLLMYACSQKYQLLPHRLTCCLVISQLIGCIGIVMWSLLERSEGWSLYLQFAVYTVGVYSSRLWTAFLAIGLLFLQCRSLCFVLKLQPLFIVLGWGIPLVLVTILMVTVSPSSVETGKCNPNFQYGDTQAGVSVFLLVLCFIVTLGCLVLQQRYHRRYARYLLLVQDVSTTEQVTSEDEDKTASNIRHVCDTPTQCSINGCGSNQVVDIEEIATSSGCLLQGVDSDSPHPGDLCPSRFSCPAERRDQCRSLVDNYYTRNDDRDDKDQQTLRHVVLLILLTCSMFVGLALSTWTLVMEDISGIYIELAFLDASLNFGQSLIVFAVFGLEPKAVFGPLVKRWRRMWYGADTIQLPLWEELPFETKHVCDQFITHHLTKCKKDIARDKRCRLKHYKESFKGVAMVDWLLGIGLARDRVEATQYAKHLLQGRVLRHVNNIHNFHDQDLLYTFTPATSN